VKFYILVIVFAGLLASQSYAGKVENRVDNALAEHCQPSKPCPELFSIVSQKYQKDVSELWVQSRVRLSDNLDAITAWSPDEQIPFSIFAIDRTSNQYRFTFDYLKEGPIMVELETKELSGKKYLAATPVEELYGPLTTINYFYESKSGKVTKLENYKISKFTFFNNQPNLFIAGGVWDKDLVRVKLDGTLLHTSSTRRGIPAVSKVYSTEKIQANRLKGSIRTDSKKVTQVSDCSAKRDLMIKSAVKNVTYLVCLNRMNGGEGKKNESGLYVRTGDGYRLYPITMDTNRYFRNVGHVETRDTNPGPRKLGYEISHIQDSEKRIYLLMQIYDKYEREQVEEAGPGYSKTYAVCYVEKTTGVQGCYPNQIDVDSREGIESFYKDGSNLWYSVAAYYEYIAESMGMYRINLETGSSTQYEIPQIVNQIVKWNDWIVAGTLDGVYLINGNNVVRVSYVHDGESSYTVFITPVK